MRIIWRWGFEWLLVAFTISSYIVSLEPLTP